jgi:methylmalonyl-CoA/ethylmalonyl-CoA epimerase
MSATIPTDPVPLLTRIDHVGIACHDLDSAVEQYRSVFGLAVVSYEVNESQGVREAMLGVGPGYVQLLEPLGPDTPVGKFLAKRGEGIHHIGYGVSSVSDALTSVEAMGVRLVDSRPRHGSMGAAIAFLHPGSLGGVLTELVQAARLWPLGKPDLHGRIGCRTLKNPPGPEMGSSVRVTG